MANKFVKPPRAVRLAEDIGRLAKDNDIKFKKDVLTGLNISDAIKLHTLAGNSIPLDPVNYAQIFLKYAIPSADPRTIPGVQQGPNFFKRHMTQDEWDEWFNKQPQHAQERFKKLYAKNKDIYSYSEPLPLGIAEAGFKHNRKPHRVKTHERSHDPVRNTQERSKQAQAPSTLSVTASVPHEMSPEQPEVRSPAGITESLSSTTKPVSLLAAFSQFLTLDINGATAFLANALSVHLKDSIRDEIKTAVTAAVNSAFDVRMQQLELLMTSLSVSKNGSSEPESDDSDAGKYSFGSLLDLVDKEAYAIADLPLNERNLVLKALRKKIGMLLPILDALQKDPEERERILTLMGRS